MRARERRTEKRFFVDNAVLDDYGLELGPGGIAVYVALCKHANIDTQECWPAYKRLADQTGMGVTFVKNAVRKLVQLGLVSMKHQYKQGGGQTSNIYTLLAVPSRVATTPQSPGASPPSRQVATNNPKVEQSPPNTAPGGAEAAVSNCTGMETGSGDTDLSPTTPLQAKACRTFNRNGSFANITQRNRFRNLEQRFPPAYLEGRLEWARGKGFQAFESAVNNPDNHNRWRETQASQPPPLKEIW